MTIYSSSYSIYVMRLIRVIIRENVQLSLPEKIGHVSVGTVDSTKSRQQSHESDSDHTNTTDELLNGQNTCKKIVHGNTTVSK